MKELKESVDCPETKKPSEVIDSFWLYAKRKSGVYPEHSENGGKWLIFVPSEKVDDIWEKIRIATEQVLLGSSSKVATARPNPNAANLETKVICVYTYDWMDENDARGIRETLRQLGITSKIPYKADRETQAGVYANRGNKRISKYYE